jgi:hypothetical protein
VIPRKAARLRHRGDGVEARALDEIADHVSAIAKPSSQRPQAPVLRAELIDDTCTAAGLTARGPSPVLQLCRELIEAGHDPRRALHAYRRGILALIVRSIGEAAGLRVNPKGNGASWASLTDLQARWRVKTEGGAP